MKKSVIFFVVLNLTILSLYSSAEAAADDLPYYLKDRGTGVASSMFGTYINKGDFLIYPFYEYYYEKYGGRSEDRWGKLPVVLQFMRERMGFEGMDLEQLGNLVRDVGRSYSY